MSGGKAEARAKGGNAVVGTGGFVFIGDMNVGPGGGADGGGKGDGRYGDCGRKIVQWGGYCSKHNLRYRAQCSPFL